MVFTLSAAMLVGTPMTASAAGLVDLYSISDGDEGSWNGGPTGTVTNTDTNTGVLIKDQEAKIVGIALDRQTVNAEVGTSETLKATVVLDSDIYSGEENITNKVVEQLSKKIKWEVLYTDGDGNKKGDSAPNPAEKVAIEGAADNRSEITLNPQHGTAPGEEVTVRATVDASYYFKADADANLNDGEWENKISWDDARKDIIYTADAKVSVKEYTENLTWRDAEGTDKTKADSPLYVKHTLDLVPMLVRDPDTANDAITWTSSAPRVAAVSATGVVTAKTQGTAVITAVSEHGAVATRNITVTQGQKASRVAIKESWEGNDLEIVAGSKNITVETYAKVDVALDADGNAMIADTAAALDKTKAAAGRVKRNAEVKNGQFYVKADGSDVVKMEVTDVITWSSNKAAFATVTPVGSQIGGGTATVSPKAVGRATITAKATNGAKATKVANVLATLTKLEIEGVKENQVVYSGQSIQLTAKRTPVQNKDAVKWTVSQEDGTTKTTNATINAKGVLTIKNKVGDGEKIKVTLAHNKRGSNITDTVTLTVKQSSIDGIAVKDNTTNTVIAQATIDGRGRVVQTKRGTENTSYINVPLNKTYTATVDVATGGLANDVALSTLTWKSNKPKVAELTGSGASAKIKAVGPGKATITVSGVRVANNKASVIKTTFTVQVKQPVTTLSMNKPTVTLAQKDKKVRGQVTGQADQKVALAVTFGPKNADKSQKKIASWAVYKNGVKVEEPVMTTGRRPAVNTAAKLTYTLTAPKAGDVYKITAKSITGATATSIVTIVAPTKAVAIAEKLNADGTLTAHPKAGASIKVGEQLQLNSYINTTNSKVTESGWMSVGSDDAKKVNAENVTYTVNKKGIVTIDKNGKVYAVKKGVVTITAKTPTGKKATLKVTVDNQ